jgi:TDG/mug DNA glycosylase family protein
VRANIACVPDHRVELDWMGEQIETLEDLLRPCLRAVCVGINPSLVSVRAGHYYQGRVGQRFFSRLRRAGVIPPAAKGTEDDVAFAADVGFTDIVKRPTARASELRASDFAHGVEALREKLGRTRPDLVIFTYKRAAEAVIGRFGGNGFLPEHAFADCPIFVMPGPYEATETAETTLARLKAVWRAHEGIGCFHGLYEPDYLSRLRSTEQA